MSTFKRWAIVETFEFNLRMFMLLSVLQFVVACIVMAAIAVVSERFGLSYLPWIVLGLAVLLSAPYALRELALVVDALLYLLTGRTYAYPHMVRESLAQMRAREQQAPIPRGIRVMVRVMQVASWIVPWRPLARCASAFLARVPENIEAVSEAFEAHRAEQRAGRAATPQTDRPSTSEFVAVRLESLKATRAVDSQPAWDLAGRFRSFELVG